MFTIYPQIANRLRTAIADLKTIDYDKGQLANPEKFYSIDFPAVLISVESVKWSDGGNKAQKGDCVISITVAINPVAQTHQNAPDIWRYINQMKVINTVYTNLKGYKGGDVITGTDEDDQEVIIQGSAFTALTRTATQRMKRYDSIQAFTHVFNCQITDNSAQPVYVKVPDPIAPAPMELQVKTPNKELVFP